MIVDKNIGSYFEVLNIDTHDQFFRYAAYILIAFGVFVFLVGFCGCCGAIRGSKCLLGLVCSRWQFMRFKLKSSNAKNPTKTNKFITEKV